MVTKYFADPNYLHEYQNGFQNKKTIQGEAGTKDAVSKMYYKMGNREMVLTETILANNLPDSFEAFYHHKDMDNTYKCTFKALSDDKTLYKTEVHYTRIDWFLPRLFAILFSGMYRKQSYRWMENFKNFVEKQNE